MLAARLAAVSASCLRMQESILALQGAAAELRSKFEHERESARTRIDELERGRAAADARMRQLERALADARQPGGSPAQEARREEMAGALAAAVDRLRARVAAVGELDPPAADTPARLAPETETPAAHAIQPETPAAVGSTADAPAAESPETGARATAADAPAADAPVAESPKAESPKMAEGPATGPPPVEASATPVSEVQVPVVQVVPRRLAAPIRRESWLAPAIRRVAERRDPKLAAELVTELLPAQRLVLERPLSYELRIAEREESWHVQVGPDRAAVGIRSALGKAAVDFTLEGRAAAYAELAAGGAGRRLRGLRIDGSRRALRALRRARRRPLALWDLAEAGIEVWPGLLLLALAEAIDPSWSVGRSFTVAFAIGAATDPAGDMGVYVQVRDGAALAVTSAPREPPATTVRVSERAFTCMLAGARAAGRRGDSRGGRYGSAGAADRMG